MRYHRIAWLDHLPELWSTLEEWFAELGETHTSLAVLTFFRSPSAHRSWVTAAGAVLDAAALAQSTLAVPWSPQAGLCIRSGYLALREIADYFDVPYDSEPAPDAPISIAREEFDAAYEELGSAGVPVRPDRDRCWRDFAGWRVNYDAPLLALASITMAPYAPWSSDRSLRVPSSSDRPACDGRDRLRGAGAERPGRSASEEAPLAASTDGAGAVSATEPSHHSMPVVDACSHVEWNTSNACGAPASSDVGDVGADVAERRDEAAGLRDGDEVVEGAVDDEERAGLRVDVGDGGGVDVGRDVLVGRRAHDDLAHPPGDAASEAAIEPPEDLGEVVRAVHRDGAGHSGVDVLEARLVPGVARREREHRGQVAAGRPAGDHDARRIAAVLGDVLADPGERALRVDQVLGPLDPRAQLVVRRDADPARRAASRFMSGRPCVSFVPIVQPPPWIWSTTGASCSPDAGRYTSRRCRRPAPSAYRMSLIRSTVASRIDHGSTLDRGARRVPDPIGDARGEDAIELRRRRHAPRPPGGRALPSRRRPGRARSSRAMPRDHRARRARP